MNRNTTIGLVLVLGAAVAALWWANATPDSRVSEATGPRRLIDPPLDEISEFEIVPAGSQSPMKFTIENGKARMTSPVTGPADYNVITMSTTMFKEMRYSKAFAASDPERPTDQMTALANPVRTVTLKDKTGRSVVCKIGAKQTLSSKSYVQKLGDDTIYLVDTDVSAEMRKSLADYRGKRLADFAVADVVRVEVTGDRQYTLVKTGEKWNIDAPFKARADAAVVGRLVNAAANLNVDKYVDDQVANLRPYGLETPRVVVTIVSEKKTPRPATTAPSTAPAEPQFDVETRTFKIALGGVADDKCFARLLDPPAPSVFNLMVSAIKDLELPVDELRDKSLVPPPAGPPQKIVYSSDSQRVTLVRNQASQWEFQPDNAVEPARPAELAAVEDLLRNLREMKAVGFESSATPDMGFDTPRASIEVVHEGQVEPLRITLAGYTPSRTGAYVRNDQDSAIAVIPAKLADDLSAGALSFWSRELMNFKRDHVTAFDITRDGQDIKLSKQNSGWRIVGPIQADCEQAALNNALADLSNLRGRRVVGLATDAEKFGLTKPLVRASVTVQAPPPPAATTQPAEPPTAEPPVNYSVLLSRQGDEVKHVYAMVVGGDRICEVDERVLQSLQAELLSTKILEMEPSQVTQLACTGAAAFTFDRSGENWRLRGEDTFPVDDAKITEFCSTLRDLRAARYVKYDEAKLADYGLDTPVMTFSVQTADGKSNAMMMSSKGPDSQSRYGVMGSIPGRVFVIKAADVPKLNVGIRHFQKQG